MVIDFGDVKRIIDKYDHVYLNDKVPNEISGYPTAEKFAEVIASEILEVSENPSIYNISVRVYEAKGQYAEYEWSDK